MDFQQHEAAKGVEPKAEASLDGLTRSTSAHLSRLLTESDHRFIQLADAVQVAMKQSQTFVEMARDASAERASDSQDSYLTDIRELFSRLEQGFRLRRTRVLDQHRDVKAIGGLLPELVRGFNRIQEIGNQLRSLGTDFAIQVVKSANAVQMFGDYSDEIKTYAREILASTSELIEQSNLLRDKLKGLDKEITRSLARLSVLAENTEREVRDTTSQLDHMMAAGASRMQRIREHGDLVGKRVTDVVVAMQFHDITRQKIEHVVEALDACVGKRLAEQSAVFKVQRHQLAQVIVDVSEAAENLDSAFGDLDGTVNTLVANLAQSGLQIEAGTLGQLSRALMNLGRSFEEAEELEQTINATMRDTMQASEQVAGRVKQVATISDHIKLQALNAIIMANQLSDGGRTLSVLASQVKELSIASDQLVEEVVTHLNHLSSQSRDLLDHDQNPDESKEDLSRIQDTVDRVSRKYSDTQHQTAEMEARIQDVDAALIAARRRAGFLPTFLDTLRSQQAELARMAARAKVGACLQGEDDSLELEDQLSRYTMESERRVHLAAAKGDKLAETTTPDTSTDSSGDDDLGDFELF